MSRPRDPDLARQAKLHDIVARAVHEELAATEAGHGYGCDHRPGQQPQCDTAAAEAVEKLIRESGPGLGL